MHKPHKNCQSCGMPLKNEKDRGSNADGSISYTYCTHCYVGGSFTRPDITMEEMKVLVKGKLKEFGFPGFLAGLFTRNIPQLERWKQASEKEIV